MELSEEMDEESPYTPSSTQNLTKPPPEVSPSNN
jgi:hypothetical protein